MTTVRMSHLASCSQNGGNAHLVGHGVRYQTQKMQRQIFSLTN